MNFTIKKIHYYSDDSTDRFLDVSIPINMNESIDDISYIYDNEDCKPQDVYIWVKIPSLNDIINNNFKYHYIKYKRSEDFTIESFDISFDGSNKIYTIDIEDDYDGPVNIEIAETLESLYKEYSKYNVFENVTLSEIKIWYDFIMIEDELFKLSTASNIHVVETHQLNNLLNNINNSKICVKSPLSVIHDKYDRTIYIQLDGDKNQRINIGSISIPTNKEWGIKSLTLSGDKIYVEINCEDRITDEYGCKIINLYKSDIDKISKYDIKN